MLVHLSGFGAPAGLRRRNTEACLNFVVEFYRSRDADEAMLDRVSIEAPNLRVALQGATELFRSLAMPQIPDRLRISDEDGSELYAGPADGAYPTDG
jgi:hypothetical protein